MLSAALMKEIEAIAGGSDALGPHELNKAVKMLARAIVAIEGDRMKESGQAAASAAAKRAAST